MRNSVLHGDCLEIMQFIPAESVDMILCDLPYGTTFCKWDAIIPFPALWAQYKRIAKPNAAIVLTASQPFTSALVMSNPNMFRYEWIWQKNRGSNFALLKWQPFKEHESVLVFSKKPARYFPIKQERSESGKSRAAYSFHNKVTSQVVNADTFYGSEDERRNIELDLRAPSSIQKFNTEVGLHPTQKPVALFEYLINTYTEPGMLVLDNCAGSGTTGIACMNTGRDYILIEQDAEYYKGINERLTKHLRRKPDWL